MRITLSFEETISGDVSIMVDALRASTSITVALNNFKKVIPCFTPEEALELQEKIGGVVAGERNGKQLEGFDIGNTPVGILNYESDEDTLILTTTNGTRILESMNAKVLVGSLVNAESVAKASCRLANNHIDVVMAGVKGKFAIEDYLAAGEILYQVCESLEEYDLSEYAKTAIMASRDYDALTEAFMNSRTAKRLIELDNLKDVEFSCQKNITENVAIFKNNELKLYI